MLEHFKRGDIDSCVPMKRQGKRSKKKHLSKQAFRKIRHKQKMWRVYKHTGKDQDYVVYKEALNEATNEVRKSKRNFELKLAQHIKSDSKSFYAYVRSKPNVGPLEDNAWDIITGGFLMAEELNMHFCSVFTRENTSSLPVPETKFNGSEGERLGQLVVTPEVVASKINNMKENKSPGVDEISPKILKETVEQISTPLAHVFNMSLHEGFVPLEWKEANIIPLFKKGSRNKSVNYRPVSLRHAPTTSHSDEETDNFYNTIDKILEKQTHYTLVMGDFNAKVGGQTNTSERATGCFGLGQRNERGDTLVEWATSKNFKIMNTQFQKKAERRWTWRSPDGHTKNEIDYIMTDKASMVTDVTVINRVNIGSDHRMVMGSITLNTRAERGKLLNKNTQTRVDTQMIGTKKNTFQLELKNRFTALEEHDDMDSLNKNMTEMIQQSALSIAKQTKQQKKPKISSPTRALMKRLREMIENKTPETT